MAGQDTASMLAQIPPGVDPSDYMQAMRQQMIAQYLTQSALTPASVENYGPMRSRVSPLQGVLKLAEALMARKMTDKSLQTQAQQYAQMLNAFGGGRENDQRVVNPGPPPAAQGPASVPFSQQQPVSPGVAPAPVRQSGTTSLNPEGLPPGLALRMYMQDPSKYGELIAGTPEWRTALRAAGGDPQAAMRMLQAELQAKGAIHARQGEDVRVPGANGQPDTWIRNPQLLPGQAPIRNESGDVMGVGTLPGFTDSAQGIKTAEGIGETFGKIQTFKDSVGAEHFYLNGVELTPRNMRRMAQGQVPETAAAPPTKAAASTVPANYFGQQRTIGPPSPAPIEKDPFPDAPKIPESHAMAPPGTSEHEIQLERGRETPALYKKYSNEAAIANTQLLRVAEAQKFIGKANMGPWSEQLTHAQGILHQVAPRVFEGGGATNTQIFGKNVINLALDQARLIYGNRMTEKEVLLQKDQASPSTKQTAEAAAYLLKQQALMSGYKIQANRDYQAWIKHGHDPLQFEGWYQANRPIQKFALQHDSERQMYLARERGANVPEAAFDRLSSNPQLIGDFKAMYGYVPDGYE